MNTIPIETYRKLGNVLKNIHSQISILYDILNSIHWTRQADQILQYKTQFEQLSYSLEHKMSKEYTDEEIKGVFF